VKRPWLNPVSWIAVEVGICLARKKASYQRTGNTLMVEYYTRLLARYRRRFERTLLARAEAVETSVVKDLERAGLGV